MRSSGSQKRPPGIGSRTAEGLKIQRSHPISAGILPSIAHDNPHRGGIGVVLEAQQRVLRSRSLKKALLLNEKCLRADVVPHVVGEGNVMRGRDKIRREEELVRSVCDLNPLLPLRMTIDSMNEQSWDNL